MDPALVALATTAATTLVTLLTTDAWERAVGALGSWWRRVHPQDADEARVALDQARAGVQVAQQAGGQQLQDVMLGLEDEWRGRLRRLLATSPDLAEGLRQLLDSELTPLLPSTSHPAGGITLTATASGKAQVYQVGQGKIDRR